MAKSVIGIRRGKKRTLHFFGKSLLVFYADLGAVADSGKLSSQERSHLHMAMGAVALYTSPQCCQSEHPCSTGHIRRRCCTPCCWHSGRKASSTATFWIRVAPCYLIAVPGAGRDPRGTRPSGCTTPMQPLRLAAPCRSFYSHETDERWAWGNCDTQAQQDALRTAHAGW